MRSISAVVLAMLLAPAQTWVLHRGGGGGGGSEGGGRVLASRASSTSGSSDSSDLDALRRAVGGGVGKHGAVSRRERANKYAPKAPVADPFEQAVASSKK